MNNMKKGLRCMVIRLKDRPSQNEKEPAGKMFIGIRCVGKRAEGGALGKMEVGK